MMPPEERLTRWFPEVYASREPNSLLQRLLLAAGREFGQVEEDLIALLTSHWVDFATDGSLDRLASCLALSRRTVVETKDLEDDSIFRVRLKDAIPYFTGGGTVKAVAGAMRWALGLPHNLERFQEEVIRTKTCPDIQLPGLIQDLKDLIRIEEFPPCAESAEAMSKEMDEGRCAASVVLSRGPSIRSAYPRIEWTVLRGACHGLKIRFGNARTIQFRDDFIVQAGKGPMILWPQGEDHPVRIEYPQGVRPSDDPIVGPVPVLPAIPTERSEWTFSASGGGFDYARFDGLDSFDFPEFRVNITWVRYPPLSFNVIIPHLIEDALKAIKKKRDFKENLQVFAGRSWNDFQGVLDQVRAAGVRGMVHFSLAFEEDHEVKDSSDGDPHLFLLLDHSREEATEVDDSALNLEGVLVWEEEQDMGEGLVLDGVFDVSPYDGIHVFQAHTE
jgi:hypothetical protein